MCVDPPWKGRVMLHERAERCQIDGIYVRSENHGVRIAHGYERRAQLDGSARRGGDDNQMLRIDRAAADLLGIDWYIRQREDRRAHVDLHALHLVPNNFQREREHAVAGLDAHGIAPGQTMIEGILGDAPDSVAAHFRLAAVGVEHAHPHVGTIGRKNEDESVRADSKMPIGHFLRRRGRIAHALGKAVHIDIVIAETLHFGESHREDLTRARASVYTLEGPAARSRTIRHSSARSSRRAHCSMYVKSSFSPRILIMLAMSRRCFSLWPSR